MSKTLILIPSRMAATRLPGKPLLKIYGKSIISQVYKKALEFGPKKYIKGHIIKPVFRKFN